MSKKAANSWIFWIYQKRSHRGKEQKVKIPNFIEAEETIEIISYLHCPQKFKNQQGLSIHIKCKHAR